MKLRHILLALLCAGSSAAPAADASAGTYGQEIQDKLHSIVLGEDRPIQVNLPVGYDPAHRKYDVVYILDGEMVGRFVPPIRAFAEENELMPPVILVSIPNLYWYDRGQDSRERDLLPARVEGAPLSGGAEAFTRFIGNELIPYVDGKYAVSGRRVLLGHSYAGLFTVYTFLTHPGLFDGFVASDPALWWNDGAIDKLAEKRLPLLPKRRQTLFIGTRSGRMSQAFGVDRFAALLRAKAPVGLRWKITANSDEDHGSVRLKNIYDGLKFTYFGASPSMIDFFPRHGIVLKGQPVPLMNYSTYLAGAPGIRYTTDGSDPTPHSPRFDWGVKVSGPAHITLKQFSNWGPDRTAKGRFTRGRALQAEPLPAAWKPGGLYHACRSASGALLTEGRTDGRFDVSRIGGKDAFDCHFDGAFKAVKDGYYIFFLDADGGAAFALGGRTWMRIDAKSGPDSFVLPLKRGLHSVHIDYHHESGDRRFDLTYLPLHGEDGLAQLAVPIPAVLQYGR
jgi:predicted alpha/beta superfamily hydrolase